jgi:hypothetical protein
MLAADVDKLINQWLYRMPDAAQAYRHDAMYHAQIKWLRRLMVAADMAMEAEGVPEQARDRVVRSLILGAPDESEALARTEQMEKAIADLTTSTLRQKVVLPACRTDCETIPGYCEGAFGCMGGRR